MNTAEERIKPYLPRALRSAVSFYDGQVTCWWDDRAIARYEDGNEQISFRSYGRREYVTNVAAAMYITERAFVDDILPGLARVLDGIYKFNVRKGTARLKGSGLGPFLDLRVDDNYNDAVKAGIRTLAGQTIRLAVADAVKRLGPCIVERTDAERTIITTTHGTVCMSPDAANRDGSVRATEDTFRWKSAIRIQPGETLPAYVIWDLIGPTE